jgi:hypothetical protein
MKTTTSRILLGGISFLIGVFFVSASWEAYGEYMRIKEYAGHATGHLTQKHYQRASDGNSIYYLDYWFLPVGGNKISSTNSILKEHWDGLKPDDTLEVRYDKSNPSRNIPLSGGSVSLVYAFFVFVLGAVFLVFGIMRLIDSFKKGPDKSAKPA